MNKQTKYYFLLKYLFVGLLISIGIGILKRFLSSLNSSVNYIVSPINDVLSTVNVILIIVLVIGAIYLVYLVSLYYSSKFYNDYRVQVFEAIYHGFMDIHMVYDRAKTSGVQDLQIDFKNSTIYFTRKEDRYCLKYLDLFGKIEGKIDSEFWASVSKPKKQYNQKTYTKRVKFPNPYRSNLEYINQLKQKTGEQYKNYVVISGFYNMKDKSSFIIAPYEMIDLLY